MTERQTTQTHAMQPLCDEAHEATDAERGDQTDGRNGECNKNNVDLRVQ